MEEVVSRQFCREDFEDVCEFLIRISNKTEQYINWNWARWQWMYFHPDFDESQEDKIKLWFANNQIIGIAVYDFYAGESSFIVDPEYQELEVEMIQYSIDNFSDGDGLGIAINDEAVETVEKMLNLGFEKHENTENILCIDLEKSDLSYQLGEEYLVSNIEGLIDAWNYNRVLWYGMDHEGEVIENDETYNNTIKMLSAANIDYKLNVCIKSGDQWIAFCGCHYNKNTDYAYVEPVCTIPEYRGKGIGSIVVKEALNRCKEMGAKKAYVISDNKFYETLGFKQHSHYTFYWKK